MLKYFSSLVLCLTTIGIAWGLAANPIILMSSASLTSNTTGTAFESQTPRTYGTFQKFRLIATANNVGTLDVTIEESPVCLGGEPSSYWKTALTFPQITSGTNVVYDLTPDFQNTLIYKCVRAKAVIGGGGNYAVNVTMHAN